MAYEEPKIGEKINGYGVRHRKIRFDGEIWCSIFSLKIIMNLKFLRE